VTPTPDMAPKAVEECAGFKKETGSGTGRAGHRPDHWQHTRSPADSARPTPSKIASRIRGHLTSLFRSIRTEAGDPPHGWLWVGRATKQTAPVTGGIRKIGADDRKHNPRTL